jgi:hypothetical protein
MHHSDAINPNTQNNRTDVVIYFFIYSVIILWNIKQPDVKDIKPKNTQAKILESSAINGNTNGKDKQYNAVKNLSNRMKFFIGQL